jgi:hypothetical protein
MDAAAIDRLLNRSVMHFSSGAVVCNDIGRQSSASRFQGTKKTLGTNGRIRVAEYADERQTWQQNTYKLKESLAITSIL